MKSHYPDFKCAAAGDDSWRDEPAGIALAASQEPVAARSAPYPDQHYPNDLKTVVGASDAKAFAKTYTGQLTYDQGASRAYEVMAQHSEGKMLGALRHMCDETEIFLKFGKSQPNSGMNLGPHCASEMELNKDQLYEPFDHKVFGNRFIQMTPLHPCIHKFEFGRENVLDKEKKPFGGIMLEIGFWKLIKKRDTIPVYMGRIKYFLPRIYDAGIVYFDLSRMYLR